MKPNYRLRRLAVRTERGFTLVELMVTVAIALFLIGGLLTVLQDVRIAYNNQQSLSQLQGALVSGFPFAFGFTIYNSWTDSNPTPTVIPMPSATDSVTGGHAVLAVGYDNSTSLFKFRNSWGKNQGEAGYFYIPYAYITNPDLASDFWVINAVKP